MTWTHIGNSFYLCESTDTKVTANITTGSILFESTVGTATEKAYRFNGTTWVELTLGTGGGGGGSGDITGAANVGTGEGAVFRDEVTGVLNFKKIKAGTGVVVTNNADDVTIDATGEGGGEANTYSTLGDGFAWTTTKTGVNLPFKSFKAGSNKLGITSNTNDLTIDITEANLTLGNIGGTLGDSKISGLAWTKLTGVPSASTSTAGIVQLATTSSDTTAGRAVQASDARLADSRTPLSHTHSGIDITTGTVPIAQLPTASESAKGIAELATGVETAAGLVIQANDPRLNDARTPVSHNHSGADITSGTVPVAQLPSATESAKGVVELGTSLESVANLVVQTNDARLTDARTPLAHNNTHALDTIGAGTDITTNNATTSQHGLLKKLSNVATEFLNGQGDWATPAGSGGEANTASNFGTVGTGLWKDKNGVDLRFYKINPVDSKLTIALNGTDRIDIGVAQANLAIAWSQLTSVPSTFAPSAHKDSHKSGGTDVFVKADVITAQTRYLENRADPASDSGAIWINPTSEIIEYWDTSSTPVLRSLINAASIQTMTNKTYNTTDNTLTATSQAVGDLLVNNGTKFVRKARGTALQVLRTNSGATDVEWASLNSENAGTASGAANGSQTAFTIAHGLGSTPYMAMVEVSSVLGSNIAKSWTYDATNITVTFASAPAAGTVTFQWRAIL